MPFIYNPITNQLDITSPVGPGSGALFTINNISPDGAGNFDLIAGTNMTIVPGTNSLTLNSTGGGGGGSVTLTGDTGGPLGPSSTYTFTGGTTGLVFAGSGTTLTLGGTLSLADGGTHASLTASNGGIFYSTASAGAILSGTVTARQMLQSGASTTPAWSTSTWPATTTANQLLYSTATSVVGEITGVNNGVLITSNSGVPSLLPNSLTAGFVLTANSGAPPSWQASGGGGTGTVTSVSVVTANGFAGTVATATTTPAITLTTSATGVLSGNGTAISGSAVTQFGVVVGGASNAVATTAVGSTGTILQGNSGAAPTYSTATYPSTTTANQILYSSATNTVSQITAANNGVLITSNSGVPSLLANSGTAGFVLTANTGAPPSWQATSSTGIVTIAGDTGSITGTNVSISFNSSSGSSAKFTNSGTSSVATLSDASANIILGQSAGNGTLSGNSNTGLGVSVLAALTSSTLNVAIGTQCLQTLSSGLGSNTAIGQQCLQALATGTSNFAAGNGAGGQFTGAESDNICINSIGVTGDNHTLRIGQGTGSSSTGDLAKAFIQGIGGVTPSGSTDYVTINPTTGQLGSVTIPGGGSGITTINGDTGSITGSTVTISTTGLAGRTVKFTNSGSSSLFSIADVNRNMLMGTSSGPSVLPTGTSNVCLGDSIFQSLSTGSSNVGVGKQPLFNISTGSSNSAYGENSLLLISSGSFNTAMGSNSASSLTAGDSSNVCINSSGVAGDNHILRIGESTGIIGTQDLQAVYIQGINGVSAAGITVGVSSSGQLSAGGPLTNPGQVAFLGYLASTVNNVTGDGTPYQLGTDPLTILFDQGSNLTTGGVFNPPASVTSAIYSFQAGVNITGCTTATTIILTIAAGSNIYSTEFVRPAGSQDLALNFNILAPMGPFDVATASVVTGGEVSPSDDIVGSSSIVTYFSGYLVC